MDTIPIISEWHFDSSYSSSEKDSLVSDLEPAVLRWASEAAPALFDELRRKPQRQFAISIQGGRINQSSVYILTSFEVTRADLPLCKAYVGPEKYFQNKADQIRDHYMRQVTTPGNEATIVEWNNQSES